MGHPCRPSAVRPVKATQPFKVVAKRWVVERTFAWLLNFRRLKVDYEERIDVSEGQGHRKVDEAVKILLTANSGEERLAMKSGFFESAPVGS